MQFSPKKTDFYISALRLNLQKRILEQGINNKKLLCIKKIEQIRITNFSNETYQTDIGFLAEQLTLALTSVFATRGSMIFFHIFGNAYGTINTTAFEQLLCEIACYFNSKKEKSRLIINISKHYIEITADKIIVSSYIKRLIEILKGTAIAVKKQQKYGIKIPISDKKANVFSPPLAQEYLENPFSSVNLALSSFNTFGGN